MRSAYLVAVPRLILFPRVDSGRFRMCRIMYLGRWCLGKIKACPFCILNALPVSKSVSTIRSECEVKGRLHAHAGGKKRKDG